MEATDQLAPGAAPERVLELVAVAPLLDRGSDRLELEVLQAPDPPQRFADLLALDLELALVGEHLPWNPRVLRLRGDPFGAGAEHLERAGVGIGALALVHHGPDTVAWNGARDEHHVAAVAESRYALAAEGERLHLELELVAGPGPRGRRQRAALRRVAHEEPPVSEPARWARPSSSSSSAFCAWRRFSACSQIRWRCAVENLGRDLLAGVGGQVVHREGALGGRVQQLVVELVGGQGTAALVGLELVTHAHPHVGVHRVGLPDGVAGIHVQGHGPGRLGRQREILRQRVAGRRGDRHVDARERPQHRQRAGHVVAVADVGEPQAGERAVGLAQRQQVSECLARVVLGAQHVDDGYGTPAGQLLQRLLRARPQADHGDVAPEHGRRIPQGLPARELHLVAAQYQRLASELVYAHLERQTRARGGLLEDQRHAASLQRGGPQRLALELLGSGQKLVELRGGQLGAGQEVRCHG